MPGGIKGVPTVSMRQLFSAEKILEILEESDEQIVLFPFVPYAASLSLGVFYRDLRHNKLRTHQARAKSWLQGGCAALVKLQAHFPPLTRTLGTVSRLLLEIDRVLLSDAAQRGSRRLRKNRTSDSPATPQIHCSDRETSSEGLTGGMPKGRSSLN